jgi:transcription factor MBP1
MAKLKKQELGTASSLKASSSRNNSSHSLGPAIGQGYSLQAALQAGSTGYGGENGVMPSSAPGETGEASDGEGAITTSPSHSSSSRTPSPIRNTTNVLGSLNDHLSGMYPDQQPSYSIDGMQAGAAMAGQKRKAEEGFDAAPSSSRTRLDTDTAYLVNPHAVVPAGPETYANIILDYFITEKARIPDCLVEPPADFDANVSIDDDGHTALHWACAMGRIRVVKLLLTAGADIFRVNHAEQTALMRSVMFSNNYDVRKFPELYQLLHKSTLNIDKTNRTVFHHIADVALSKGKTHAARYYMETILSHLEDFPRELEDVINFQDEEGETALTLAARARSKRLVKALLDHGADPKAKNRDGKSAEDYILEDERFRSSPTLGGQLKLSDTDGSVRHGIPSLAPQLYHSQSAQQAAGKYTTDMTGMLDDLARSYDTELQQKEKDISQAQALLVSLRGDIEEAKKNLADLQAKSAGLQGEKEKVAGLQNSLEENMGRRYRAGWQAWLSSQKQRERDWEQAGRPEGDEWNDVTAVIKTEGTGEGEEMGLSEVVEQGKHKRVGLFKQYVMQQADVSRLIRSKIGRIYS